MLKKQKEDLGLLNTEDVMNITGWGKHTVDNMMAEEDFPLLQIGKKNEVLFDALKEYLMHRRTKKQH